MGKPDLLKLITGKILGIWLARCISGGRAPIAYNWTNTTSKVNLRRDNVTEVWPSDVEKRLRGAPTDSIRPPRCLLLMPFSKKFDEVTALIHDTARAVFEQFRDFFELQKIDRLDWIASSGAIQQQIWQKIIEADLVICDLTEYNPNVMFESGVTAAWKTATQVVFIKDRTFSLPA